MSINMQFLIVPVGDGRFKMEFRYKNDNDRGEYYLVSGENDNVKKKLKEFRDAHGDEEGTFSREQCNNFMSLYGNSYQFDKQLDLE